MTRRREDTLREIYRRFAGWVKTGEVPPGLVDPEIEFDLSHVFPDRGRVRGIEPFREAILEYAEAFEEWTIEPQEVIELDDDRYLVSVRDGGRIKRTGAEIYNDFTHLWTFRGEVAIRWSGYFDERRARQAAGLAD